MLLGHYRQFLLDSPLGVAGICLAGFDAELETLPLRFGTGEADLLLAWVGAASGGCVAIAVRPLADGTRAAELKRLWVEPQFRGAGLGRALIKHAVEWSAQHACAAVVLDTIKEVMPEAGALYVSMGFAEIERYNDNHTSGIRFYRLDVGGGQVAT
jgi:GNAT superfamily N-acetyltransferase